MNKFELVKFVLMNHFYESPALTNIMNYESVVY